MLFRQVIHEDLGCASYLIGDTSSGEAVVVDPQWSIEPYLRLARLHGVTITHVLETHNHADHVSGHGRLARATGAQIHIHEIAEAEYPHEAFADGWTLSLGQVEIEALHTPGHRPEHTSFLLRDRSRGGGRWAVLTGDSLFVGDVARPDLAVEPREGAIDIHRSLHERLFTLPAEVEVWPGHLGGSLCGGPGMDMKTSSTIGFERDHSELLASVGLRVRGFLSGGMTAWRSEGRPVQRLETIDPAGLAERLESGDGLLVLDVRDDADYAGGRRACRRGC